MAVASPTLSLAVDAAMNKASEYIARAAFAPTAAQGVTLLPGGTTYKAKGYRIDRQSTQGQPGDVSILHAPGTGFAQRQWRLTDFDIEIEQFGAEWNSPSDYQAEDSLARLGIANLSAMISPTIIETFRQDEERRAAAKLKDTAIFTQGANAALTPWTSASVNPVSQLQTGGRACKVNGGLYPNLWVVSDNYWNAFINNPNVQNYLGLLPGAIQPELVAKVLQTSWFGADGAASPEDALRIKVATAVASTSNWNAASPTYGFIYDSHCVLMRSAPPTAEGVYLTQSVQDAVDPTKLVAGKMWFDPNHGDANFAVAIQSYLYQPEDQFRYQAKMAASPVAFEPLLAYTIHNAV